MPDRWSLAAKRRKITNLTRNPHKIKAKIIQTIEFFNSYDVIFRIPNVL